MADVRLKDPNSDFVAVVGSPIEAANLRARGYTDVVDDTAGDGPQAKLDGSPEQTAGNTGTEGSAGGDGQGEQQADGSRQSPDTSAEAKPPTQRTGRAKS
jgi:hypothetical protein